jgi:hypothetical protein
MKTRTSLIPFRLILAVWLRKLLKMLQTLPSYLWEKVALENPAIFK